MIISVIEVLVAAFLIWGLFHEDKFVMFADRLFHRKPQNAHQCKITKFNGCTDNPKNCA